MRASVSSGVTPRLFRSAAFAMLCVIWGSTWLAIRIGLQGAPPFLAASLRFFVASATLAVLALPFRSKWPANRTEWKLVVFVGLVLFTADYGLIYWGENNGVESGLSAILFATLPLLTAVVANALLPGERLTVQKLAGIGLGFGGILLIFRGQIATAGADKAFPMIAIVLSAPIAAILLGATVGNETFDAVDLIGSAIVLGGIYVSISRRVALVGRAVSARSAAASANPIDPPDRPS